MSGFPFWQDLPLIEQGGDPEDPIRIVACSTWAMLSERTTSSGVTYDWLGEAELGAASELIGHSNRQLVVEGGKRLRIMGAVRHDFLPHVQLRMKEMRPGG